MGVIALVFIAGVTVASFAAPLLPLDKPEATDFLALLHGPSGAHLLGTDELGRDVLSRLIYGGTSMIIATMEAVVIAIVLGAAAGIAGGYFRGATDRALGWAGDVVLSIPVLIVLLVILTVNTKTLTPAAVALGVLLSVGPMRVVRSAALSVREELFIDAARVAGLSHRRIMYRHVLPRVTGPIIVQASLVSAVALLMITGLAFLGLGVNPPAPTWGSMVSEAASSMQQQGWFIVPAGGIIGLTVLALGLFGDAVRDVLGESGKTHAGRQAGSRSRGGRSGVTAQPGTGDGELGPVLAVRDLRVNLHLPAAEVTVVEGVGLDVRPGEILGLVGESGSGKTLTARAIIGLLPAGAALDGGNVWLDGTDLTALSGRKLTAFRREHIAYVSQNPMTSLDPTFTVGSALQEALYYREGLPRKKSRQRAIELLDTVRLPSPEDVLRRYPHQLSGGMAQRVAIAHALAGRPRLLIADEPTTALDVTVQSEILDLFRKLRDDTGMAVLIITHDWGVVADVCDRAVVMYCGQIVEYGQVDAVFAAPAHPYTAGLLAASPHQARRGEPLPAIPGSVSRPWEWPVSCRFADRCTLVTEACRAGAVPLQHIGTERASRCLLSGELVSVEAK
jgi:peptide/nickel transport system permease protein